MSPQQSQRGRSRTLARWWRHTRRGAHPDDLFYRNRVLRPGWGILLFLIVIAITVAVQTFLLLRFAHLRDTPHTDLTPRDCIANGVMAVAVSVATWVLATREQRRFADYGFRAGGIGRNLFGGILAGVALLSALVLLLHQLDLLVFRGQVLFGAAQQWRLAGEWIAFYLLSAYVDEALAHGYLQYTLTRGFAWLLRHYFAASSGVQPAFWIAAVLLSIGFALLQQINGGESALGLVNAALFALLMAFSLWRTGSLWWALGYHAAWDWTQSFLWGVPNSGMHTRDHLFLTEATGSSMLSGGVTGPEGSVYTLGALLAGFGILMLLKPRLVYPELWEEAARDSGETGNMLPDPDRTPARG